MLLAKADVPCKNQRETRKNKRMDIVVLNGQNHKGSVFRGIAKTYKYGMAVRETSYAKAGGSIIRMNCEINGNGI